MARQHAILARSPGATWRNASARDFVTLPMGDVDLLRIAEYEPRSISPYALDFERKRVLFVWTDEDVDLSTRSPFYYEAQRREADRLIVADMPEVIEAAKRLTVPEHRLAFLYSTGRCGSTLLSKMAFRFDGVQSVSEPDFYTHANRSRVPEDPRQEKTIEAVVRATSLFLAHHLIARRPHRRVILIKHRGWTVYLADLVKRALPESRSVFMYRDPAAVVASYDAAFLRHPLLVALRSVGLDHLLVRAARETGALGSARFLPLLDSPDFEDAESQSFTGALSMVWHSIVSEMQRQKIADPSLYDDVMRYEDLIAAPVAFVERLARSIGAPIPEGGLSDGSVEAILGTLEENSQAGSKLASSGSRLLGSKESEIVTRLLRRAGMPGMILGGT